MDKKQLRNTLLLICAAFIWGTAFVAQSVGSGYMGAYTFLASRSWLACVFLLGMLLVRHAGQKKRGLPFWIHGKTLVLGGICCGTALFAASAAQQMGIGTTSTAKAGFMTALYVVLVPVAGVFLGSRPGIKLWCCVAVSVVGLYLLCLAGRDTLSLTGGEPELLFDIPQAAMQFIALRCYHNTFYLVGRTSKAVWRLGMDGSLTQVASILTGLCQTLSFFDDQLVISVDEPQGTATEDNMLWSLSQPGGTPSIFIDWFRLPGEVRPAE